MAVVVVVAADAEVTIEGPAQADIVKKEVNNGVLTIDYLPVIPGEYLVNVKSKGKHINGSPFSARISGLTRPTIYFSWNCHWFVYFLTTLHRWRKAYNNLALSKFFSSLCLSRRPWLSYEGSYQFSTTHCFFSFSAYSTALCNDTSCLIFNRLLSSSVSFDQPTMES